MPQPLRTVPTSASDIARLVKGLFHELEASQEDSARAGKDVERQKRLVSEIWSSKNTLNVLASLRGRTAVVGTNAAELRSTASVASS